MEKKYACCIPVAHAGQYEVASDRGQERVILEVWPSENFFSTIQTVSCDTYQLRDVNVPTTTSDQREKSYFLRWHFDDG